MGAVFSMAEAWNDTPVPEEGETCIVLSVLAHHICSVFSQAKFAGFTYGQLCGAVYEELHHGKSGVGVPETVRDGNVGASTDRGDSRAC